MSCVYGKQKGKDGGVVDYFEFRNSRDDVAMWKIAEFLPDIQNGDLGRKLQLLRDNPPQLATYLNHLIR